MKRLANIFKTMTAIAVMVLPFTASAHEVYVLSPAEVAYDKTLPPVNLLAVALSHKNAFLTAIVLGIVVILIVLGLSLSRALERAIDPVLFKIKPYAGHIVQITLGIALIASAHYGALFGPELPLPLLFGMHATLIATALYIAGGFLLFGVYPRVGALITIAIFAWSMQSGQGIYMLSYLTYCGEGLVIFLFGGGYALASHTPEFLSKERGFFFGLKKRKDLIMRIAFAASLIYTALYAKLIHGALALNTVLKYHLTNYFHFDPLFIVLGAFLIEMAIGTFFLIGFEIRFTALFFLTFLTMSLVFFGESVWPHVILIGTSVAFFVHGYDNYTIESVWYKKGKREPVL